MKTNSMNGFKNIFLKPGEYYFGEMQAMVTTVLGSCVTVTMFNARKRFGAICHGLLPHCPDKDTCTKNFTTCFKFVDCSIRQILDRFKRHGIDTPDIEVKLFGGAHVFATQNSLSIGKKNVQAARDALQEAGLHLTSYSYGGRATRKVIFNTGTGEVWLKKHHDPVELD